MLLKSRLKEKFTTIPNQLFDCGLSSKAIHLFCYLATKPENWVVYNADIKDKLGIKDDATVAKVWKELLDMCWIERKIAQDPETKRAIGGSTITLMDYEGMVALTAEKSRIGKKAVLGKNPNTEKTPDIINNNNINKTEKEKYKKESLALPPSRSNMTAIHSQFQDWWNNVLIPRSNTLDSESNIARFAVFSEQRKRAFNQRWKETKNLVAKQGIKSDDEVFEYLTKKVIGYNYINSRFLRGLVKSDKYPDAFLFTVDYVLRPSTWTKLLENGFLDRNFLQTS